MSIREKVKYTIGKNSWQTYDDDSLRSITMSDGPSGIRLLKDYEKNQDNMSEIGTLPSTLYPSAHVLASTFNPTLAETYGIALGTQCNEHGIDILLGPGINIKRLSNGGRNFEYYSEDPLLSGVLGGWVISGIQKTSTAACLKHFIANNQESERHRINVVMDEQTFYEVYLYAFRKAISIGNPWAIMVAYNKFSGDYCTANEYLLVDILKETLGYQGLVISDWGAVHQPSDAIRLGIDVIMPGPSEDFAKDIRYSADNGLISEERFDNVIFKLGRLIELVSIESEIISDKDPHQVAYEVAKEGIVLLENNGVLPLKKATKLHVIGKYAKSPKVQGRGSSFVNPLNLITPLACLKDSGFDVSYSKECPEVIEGDVILYFAGTTEESESEGYDREHLDIDDQQYQKLCKLVEGDIPVVLIMQTGGVITLHGLEKKVAAYVYAGFAGEAIGEVLRDLLIGEFSPSGRLAETMPHRYEDTPAFLFYPSTNNVAIYGEGAAIGYSYYHKKKMPVVYPFGYGLSYGSVEYEILARSREDYSYSIDIKVTNTSKVDVKEVVQLYVEPLNTRHAKRFKRLRGFKKVHVAAKSSTIVTLTLRERDFEYFDIHFKEWYIDEGDYKIIIGKNALDISFEETVHLVSNKVFSLSPSHTLSEWIAHPLGKQAIEATLKAFNQVVSLDPNNSLIKMALDMPIDVIAQMAANEIDVAKQQLLDVLQEFLDDFQ